TPSGPVSVPRPDLVTERPAGQGFLPSLRTELAQGKQSTADATARAKIEKMATDRAFIMEKITDMRVMRDPKILTLLARAKQAESAGDLDVQQALLAEARRSTEDALRGPRVETEKNKGANLADMPGSRAAD